MQNGLNICACHVGTCVKLSMDDCCEVLFQVRWGINFVFCNIVNFDSPELHSACNWRGACVTNVDIWIDLKGWWFWIRFGSIWFV